MRSALLACALTLGAIAFAPIAEADAAGCGFLGLYPCAAPPAGSGQTATVSCGFLGLQKCPAPGTTPAPGGATVSCGFLNLQTCPAPSAPAPPPTRPDPGGDELADVPTPPPGGKLFGFSSALFAWTTSAQTEVAYERAVGANAQRYSISWERSSARRLIRLSPSPPNRSGSSRPTRTWRATTESTSSSWRTR